MGLIAGVRRRLTPPVAAAPVTPAVAALSAAMRDAAMATATPAGEPVAPPVAQVEPMAERFGRSTDWRVFADYALQRPEAGGIFYATCVTNLCRTMSSYVVTEEG